MGGTFMLCYRIDVSGGVRGFALQVRFCLFALTHCNGPILHQ